jgi:hypothetical protein
MMKLLLSTAFFELPCCSATSAVHLRQPAQTSANSVGTLCFAVSRCSLKLPRDGALRVGYPTAMIHLHPPSCLSSICFPSINLCFLLVATSRCSPNGCSQVFVMDHTSTAFLLYLLLRIALQALPYHGASQDSQHSAVFERLPLPRFICFLCISVADSTHLVCC